MKCTSIAAVSAGMSCLLFIASAQAQSAPADKSHYTMFNPTPRELMRDMVTDRPDVTEAPYTLDAGHVQIESSFVEYTYDDDHGVRTDGLSVLPSNLKIGLCNNADLQFIVNPYLNIRQHGNGASSRVDGFGDLTLRLKVNIWGNDGGKTAFGLMPYIKIPTADDDLGNRKVEGGLIVPLAINLAPKWDLGTMVEFDINRDAGNKGYGLNVLHTITLDHEITEKLGAYIEYAGYAPMNLGRAYSATFDMGLMYAVTEDVQLDCGMNLGLTQETPDALFFAGISIRK